MLLYIQNKAFPHKTFVVLVQLNDSIARVRAHLLHILYELGREDHQFRLRYKGQYLRDAYSIEDYKLIDNAVITMVPLSRKQDSSVDLRSDTSSETKDDLNGRGHIASVGNDVKHALYREVNKFNRREKYCSVLQGLVYIHFMATCFAPLTFYWYSVFWTGIIGLYCWYLVPSYTRIGGFVGTNSIYKNVFCLTYGTLAVLNFCASAVLGTLTFLKIYDHGCANAVFVDGCSQLNVFTFVYSVIHAVILAITAILVWLLYFNMKVQTGEYIERYLVQTRDIEKLLQAAKHGKPKDQRVAAFELATLAASGDDNKFSIVAEGGIEVLISMSLSRDLAIQEHAVETLAELLTIPAIQDKFVEMGGVSTLTPLLLSPEPRIVQEAATALSYIVSDSEENKHAVVADRGLEDIIHATHNGDPTTQKIVGGILFELAFNMEIRAQMVVRNTPAKALTELARSADEETVQSALQALELLAIESSDMICAQEDLLDVLLALPMRSVDERLYLFAGKILLYFAENKETCEKLIEKTALKNALRLYGRGKESRLQKAVLKIIFYFTEDKDMKAKARDLDLEEVLKDIRDNAFDREVWDMADEGIVVLGGDDDELSILPPLSTMEKLHRMETRDSIDDAHGGEPSQSPFGSQSSLTNKKEFTDKPYGFGSKPSLSSATSSSSMDMKKGID